MPVLNSGLDMRSEAYQRNRADMLEMIGVLEGLLQEAAQGGGESFDGSSLPVAPVVHEHQLHRGVPKAVGRGGEPKAAGEVEARG